MSTLVQRVVDLATRTATEAKSLRTLINGNTADLTNLSTTNKQSLVSAMNELYTNIQTLQSQSGAVINDAATSSSTQTYSVNKILSSINAAVAAVINASPTALDTLKELADALGNDPNFAATITAALGKRVRFDAAQTLNLIEQAQVRTNIDAYGSIEIGAPDTSFVTVFNTGLS